MTPEDVAGDPVEIWPENLTAFKLFDSLSSQWRVSMAGRTGLDYGVMFQKMDRMGLSPEQYDELENQMRVLEHAALDEMSKE
ncbi:DUF1799 domain-containing protein [Achromobacter denitrificans]|uniref:DUF1799 domain-containing protein n=1 Tax=Achromobacter denitrificans TaxID=32002 RepID=UPI002431AF6F|nr:DUF1799 domain-containing protein [Achromobacter denitrificans]MBV2160248.1 DUF1799 domain-containing protein [Achromobacter denitrificans]